MCDHMDRHTPKGNVSLGASCPQRYLLKAMMFTHASPFTCCWVYVSGYIISLDRSLSRSLSPFPVSGTHTLFCPNVVSSLIHACIISSYFVASSNPLLFFPYFIHSSHFPLLPSFSPPSHIFITMVSTSTTTCQIKLKWHTFFMWIKSSSSSAQRKRSTTKNNTQCCGFCGHHSNNQQPPPVIDDEAWKPTPRRGSKSSNTSDASAGTASTSWSTSSKPIMSLLFRRRASASAPEMEEIDRERERIEEMYALAMDEVCNKEECYSLFFVHSSIITLISLILRRILKGHHTMKVIASRRMKPLITVQPLLCSF